MHVTFYLSYALAAEGKQGTTGEVLKQCLLVSMVHERSRRPE